MCCHSASVTRSHHGKSLPNTCCPPMFLPPRTRACLMRPIDLKGAASKGRLRALGGRGWLSVSQASTACSSATCRRPSDPAEAADGPCGT
ncbi:hypothetical protein D1114_20655 [Cereibacter sphaeroides]|uniref:Uncharacterized protein n=1 Tax=Cereibacter sphaeroides TaxID=1063 RepID=A0AAX1UFU7_CERSP|nr:hypothetical protein D1114_20655 [Cereibacter sphaeroides]